MKRDSDKREGIPKIIKSMIEYIGNEGLYTRDIFKHPRNPSDFDKIVNQINDGLEISEKFHS